MFLHSLAVSSRMASALLTKDQPRDRIALPSTCRGRRTRISSRVEGLRGGSRSSGIEASNMRHGGARADKNNAPRARRTPQTRSASVPVRQQSALHHSIALRPGSTMILTSLFSAGGFPEVGRAKVGVHRLRGLLNFFHESTAIAFWSASARIRSRSAGVPFGARTLRHCTITTSDPFSFKVGTSGNIVAPLLAGRPRSEPSSSPRCAGSLRRCYQRAPQRSCRGRPEWPAPPLRRNILHIDPGLLPREDNKAIDPADYGAGHAYFFGFALRRDGWSIVFHGASGWTRAANPAHQSGRSAQRRPTSARLNSDRRHNN